MHAGPTLGCDVTESTFPLDILRAPDDSTIDRLVEGWLGPPTVPEFEPVIEGPMPEPLVALYRVAGRWPALFKQNRLVPPADVRMDLGRRVIIWENQDVWRWAIDPPDLELDDPPVWLHGHQEPAHDQPRRATEPLSRVLLSSVLTEVVLGHPRSYASGEPPEHVRDLILAPLERVPIAPIGAYPTSHFAGEDVIIEADGDDPPWLFVAGRTEDALDYLIPIIGDATHDSLWALFSRWRTPRA
jgi:hypothetical protein